MQSAPAGAPGPLKLQIPTVQMPKFAPSDPPQPRETGHCCQACGTTLKRRLRASESLMRVSVMSYINIRMALCCGSYKLCLSPDASLMVYDKGQHLKVFRLRRGRSLHLLCLSKTNDLQPFSQFLNSILVGLGSWPSNGTSPASTFKLSALTPFKRHVPDQRRTEPPSRNGAVRFGLSTFTESAGRQRELGGPFRLLCFLPMLLWIFA